MERELFEVGRRLAAALPTTRNPLKVLDDKAMDLASSDAELKAALFRFVDVVPACRNLDDLARHLTALPGRGRRAAAVRRRGDEDGQLQGRAPRARDGGRGGRQAHGAPLHRRRGPEGRAGRPQGPVEGRRGRRRSTCWARRRSPRPRRSATPTAARTRSTRSPAPPRAGRRAPQLERDTAGPLPRANLSVKVSALDAAAASRRARARQARRRRPAAAAAAPRPRARRAPAHRHGVDGLARRGARADPRAAGRGRVPRRAVRRPRAPGLPARLAGHARHDPRPGSTGRARGARSR